MTFYQIWVIYTFHGSEIIKIYSMDHYGPEKYEIYMYIRKMVMVLK